MITGTIYNAGKMLVMTQKWEQKKIVRQYPEKGSKRIISGRTAAQNVSGAA